MDNRNHKFVLITGASSGLGLEFAKLAAQEKYSLILTARRKTELDKIAATLRMQHNIIIHTIEKDISNLTAASEIFEEVNDKLRLQVFMLVNNAGFGLSGDFFSNDLTETINQINVNVTSLVALTRLFLPSMIERDEGVIINVGSTAAYQPGPYMSIYYASKAFVKNFTLALNKELKDTNVKCSLFSPGPTRTDFQRRANITKSVIGREFLMMEADEAVKIGFNSALKGKREIIPGIMNKLGVIAAKLSPEFILSGVVAGLNKNRFKK